MKTKTHSGNIRFELNGYLFADREAAVSAAKLRIEEQTEAHYHQSGDSSAMPVLVYDRFLAEEPPGTVIIEARLPNRSREESRKAGYLFTEFIREVDPTSPTFGKYVAWKWTMQEVERWQYFAACPDEDFSRFSPEEIQYADVACTIGMYFVQSRTVSQLSNDLARRWDEAFDEEERNLTAEILLCARDIGIKVHFKKAQGLGLEVRAAELARVRKEAEQFSQTKIGRP
jgi:hypothetical protein